MLRREVLGLENGLDDGADLRGVDLTRDFLVDNLFLHGDDTLDGDGRGSFDSVVGAVGDA